MSRRAYSYCAITTRNARSALYELCKLSDPTRILLMSPKTKKSLVADMTILAIRYIYPESTIEAKKGRDGRLRLRVVRKRRKTSHTTDSTTTSVATAEDAYEIEVPAQL